MSWEALPKKMFLIFARNLALLPSGLPENENLCVIQMTATFWKNQNSSLLENCLSARVLTDIGFGKLEESKKWAQG